VNSSGCAGSPRVSVCRFSVMAAAGMVRSTPAQSIHRGIGGARGDDPLARSCRRRGRRPADRDSQPAGARHARRARRPVRTGAPGGHAHRGDLGRRRAPYCVPRATCPRVGAGAVVRQSPISRLRQPTWSSARGSPPAYLTAGTCPTPLPTRCTFRSRGTRTRSPVRPFAVSISPARQELTLDLRREHLRRAQSHAGR